MRIVAKLELKNFSSNLNCLDWILIRTWCLNPVHPRPFFILGLQCLFWVLGFSRLKKGPLIFSAGPQKYHWTDAAHKHPKPWRYWETSTQAPANTINVNWVQARAIHTSCKHSRTRVYSVESWDRWFSWTRLRYKSSLPLTIVFNNGISATLFLLFLPSSQVLIFHIAFYFRLTVMKARANIESVWMQCYFLFGFYSIALRIGLVFEATVSLTAT